MVMVKYLRRIMYSTRQPTYCFDVASNMPSFRLQAVGKYRVENGSMLYEFGVTLANGIPRLSLKVHIGDLRSCVIWYV